jgi:uncharacterized delta-60 repeat protein
MGKSVKHLLIILISLLLLFSFTFISCSSTDDTTSTDNTTWTKQLGTSSWDEGNGVTTDSSGNIYVTGYTNGDLDGNISSGDDDIFLVKYDSSGTKQWTKQLGTSSGDRGNGVTTDSSGNVYVTGQTYGGLDGNTSSGSSDIFLVKYNSSGTKQWTKQLGTSPNDLGYDVTTDSSGNIYVTGTTWGGLDGNTISGYGSDMFLVKYNSSGTKQWTKQLGTGTSDPNVGGNGVTTDSSDNIYVTGATNGDLDGNISSGESDIFLVKYNSSGTKQWTKQLGTSEKDYGNGVTTDPSDNIYVTGWTLEGLDGNTHSGYGYDIFLVKYNSSGTKQWTKQLGTSSGDLGTSSGDVGYDVTTDSSGNIYVTGSTRGGLDGNTSSGSIDIFLVKYNSSGTKQWTKQLGTSSWDEGNGVTTDSSGNIYVTGHTGGLDGNINSGGLDGNINSGFHDIFLVKYNSSGTKQ